ncbi:MAG: LysM peptidoglycan-binding domain-containing protein [Intrasporangium sp.]|uniref:LysM peptidoglycan-binding domain-containing protein n=1 Tax=Intrasporangium sp. TaxID=1925024 RepID=UPI00264A3E3D|nr:LysM peptidoglycan-binding domain-containing protein [Intrasporangium sp.]MDN5794960.1 LysM peptidoglycan-binding domain-containing protein [Intrasporangium sp.]
MGALTVQPILDPAVDAPAWRPSLVLVPTGSGAQGFSGTAPAGRLHVTRRGRVLLTLAVLALLATAGLGATMAFASTPAQPHTVTVQAGQTLSEIAVAELPGVAPHDAIVEIQVANSLSTDQVHMGQTLTIPAG